MESGGSWLAAAAAAAAAGAAAGAAALQAGLGEESWNGGGGTQAKLAEMYAQQYYMPDGRPRLTQHPTVPYMVRQSSVSLSLRVYVELCHHCLLPACVRCVVPPLSFVYARALRCATTIPCLGE